MKVVRRIGESSEGRVDEAVVVEHCVFELWDVAAPQADKSQQAEE